MSSKRIGKIIKAGREAKGLTQEELAAKVGVAKPYITMLETGARENPSRQVAKRLSRVLGVSLAELAGHRTFWQAEAYPEPGPSMYGALQFDTREEAEAEARRRGYHFVVRYRGYPGDMIRRADRLRPQR